MNAAHGQEDQSLKCEETGYEQGVVPAVAAKAAPRPEMRVRWTRCKVSQESDYLRPAFCPTRH